MPHINIFCNVANSWHLQRKKHSKKKNSINQLLDDTKLDSLSPNDGFDSRLNHIHK